MRMISVSRDFTPYPGGRYRRHGKGSGQEFREEILIPLMKSQENAEIDLDGASGYPPSFLDEAFGGLVREGYTAADIKKKVRFKAGPTHEIYINMIWAFVEKAESQAGT